MSTPAALLALGCGCWFGLRQYHFCKIVARLINEGWEPGMNVVLRGHVEDAARDHYEDHGVPARAILLHVKRAQLHEKRTGRPAYVQ